MQIKDVIARIVYIYRDDNMKAICIYILNMSFCCPYFVQFDLRSFLSDS